MRYNISITTPSLPMGVVIFCVTVSTIPHFAQSELLWYNNRDEFKDRNLEFLNQSISFIPFTAKIRLPKLNWKNITIFIPESNSI